jgi:hypothetical protein
MYGKIIGDRHFSKIDDPESRKADSLRRVTRITQPRQGGWPEHRQTDSKQLTASVRRGGG